MQVHSHGHMPYLHSLERARVSASKSRSIPLTVTSTTTTVDEREITCVPLRWKGDVVIGTSVVPASCKIIRPDGRHEHVGQRIGLDRDPLREIEADKTLIEVALKCSRHVTIPPWPTAGHRPPRVLCGKICSYDTYVGTHLLGIIRQAH